MSPERGIVSPESDEPRFTMQQFADALEDYLNNDPNIPLYDTQIPVLWDAHAALAAHERLSHIVSPTGTGKTAMFSVLAKALSRARLPDGTSPRILITEPRKKLVLQTVGLAAEEDGEKRGFAKFAPELRVGTYFGETELSARQAIDLNDVTITTYQSFVTMPGRTLMRSMTPEEEQDFYNKLLLTMTARDLHKYQDIGLQLDAFDAQIRRTPTISTGQSLLKLFDFVIMDEAHHVLGEANTEVTKQLKVPIMGFTATDEAEKKRVKQVLPYVAHKRVYRESIDSGQLAPIMPLAVRTKQDLSSSDLFDSSGEYQEDKLGHLADNHERNLIGVEIARVFHEVGIPHIVSCVSGGGAYHARQMAHLMKQAGIRVAAQHGAMRTSELRELDAKYERGELDAFTYVQMIGEGWDMPRTKGLINLRPTRSPIVATQRVGRITRPGGLAVAVDLIDKHNVLNPPMQVLDVLNEESAVRAGVVFGEATDEELELADKIVSLLRDRVELVLNMTSEYNDVQSKLLNYPKINNGNLSTGERGHYATAASLARTYHGLSEEIIEKMWGMAGEELDTRLGVSGTAVMPTYNARTTRRLLATLPNGDPKMEVKIGNTRWLSANTLSELFKQYYPELTPELTVKLLGQLGEELSWRPIQFKETTSGNTLVGVYKAYERTSDNINLMARHFKSYFGILEALRDAQTPTS